jgi:hypothetical protein
MLGPTIVRRAASVWRLRTVPYSQVDQVNGYRADCSGYVAAVCGLPAPGPNTAQLVAQGWVRRITRDELEPGDLIGRLGPGTEGDAGHVAIFAGWIRPGAEWLGYEQAGGTLGPVQRAITYPYDDETGFAPYRIAGGTDAMDAAETLSLRRAEFAAAAAVRGDDPLDLNPEGGTATTLRYPNRLHRRLSAIEAALGRVEAAVAAAGHTGGGAGLPVRVPLGDGRHLVLSVEQ